MNGEHSPANLSTGYADREPNYWSLLKTRTSFLTGEEINSIYSQCNKQQRRMFFAARLGMCWKDLTERDQLLGPRLVRQIFQVFEREATKRALAQLTITVPLRRQPPKNAELLLSIFVPREQQEYAIGCFTELYGKRVTRLGERRARIWAWCEVAKEGFPFLKRAIKRVTGFATAAVLLRRLMS
jgi:hypothetical protein